MPIENNNKIDYQIIEGEENDFLTQLTKKTQSLNNKQLKPSFHEARCKI